MSSYRVPFNKPCFLGNEIDYVKEAVASGHIEGCGPFTKKAEKLLEQQLGSRTLLATSATHALEMCAMLLEIKPGDEVILPSFTFVSTANPFLMRGAVLRFVDNDRFGNLDLAACAAAITKKTKAVVVVHYAGNSTDMDALSKLCRENGIALVEDAAQAIDSKFTGSVSKNKALGTFGALGCISFHSTKNTTCGEGGALIVNDKALVDRAEIIREKGTNRSQFFQGLVDKYTWVDVGSSYVLSELNAAFLLPQLQDLKKITDDRRRIWNQYEKALKQPLKKVSAKILEHPEHNTPNYHLFAILLADAKQRAGFIAFMKERSILTPFHYVALHTSPVGSRFVLPTDKFPNCMRFSDCLVRLPVFYGMSVADQEHVVSAVLEWISKNS